jgi:hypothetical protein
MTQITAQLQASISAIPQEAALFVLVRFSAGNRFPFLDTNTVQYTLRALTENGIDVESGDFEKLCEIYVNLSRSEKCELRAMHVSNNGGSSAVQPQAATAFHSADDFAASLLQAIPGEFSTDMSSFDMPFVDPSFSDTLSQPIDFGQMTDTASTMPNTDDPGSHGIFNFTAGEVQLITTDTQQLDTVAFAGGLEPPYPKPPSFDLTPCATNRKTNPTPHITQQFGSANAFAEAHAIPSNATFPNKPRVSNPDVDEVRVDSLTGLPLRQIRLDLWHPDTGVVDDSSESSLNQVWPTGWKGQH